MGKLKARCRSLRSKLRMRSIRLRMGSEELKEISAVHNIASVPTFVVFKHGEEVDRLDGVDAGALAAFVNKHAAIAVDMEAQLNERIEAIINQSKVMLFMKGDPAEPRCGFSRTTVGLLQEANVEFGTFDILSDEDVRQGIKKLKNWPTFPQLYSKGELVGGLDILKELIEEDELADALE